MNAAPTTYIPRLLPLRLPRLCVAIIGSDPTEMVDKAELLVRDNSFMEFRLDYLSKPGLALPRIKRFIESHPGTVVIATCRRASNGGKFRGSIASQLGRSLEPDWLRGLAWGRLEPGTTVTPPVALFPRLLQS